MKLVWSPETATKAFIDTVKSCKLYKESGVAELISAMAAGWNAQLIVETWSRGGPIATSIGLAVAAAHSGGRHVCIVPDEASKSEYVESMRWHGQPACDIVVGLTERAVEEFEGVDFLVANCARDDLPGMLRAAKLGERGAVIVCKNASLRATSDSKWWGVIGGESRRIVRSVFLPVGKGLVISHVGATGRGGSSGSGEGKGKRRWIKHVDRRSGEEFVFRK
ncbi:Protein of unknown function (DUF1442 [Striga hermonthica]|uniref:S-adenosyl-L-methionine-dependent methyltransferase n=1 Tax=Striga hermonthica TaxID=68872 RepID=A0A9N7MVG8_STRHE|nr:Protein of unknown function (DUF1442 [Striga hermonthica]